MKKLILGLVALVALSAPSNTDAQAGAEAWLSLVDGEKYADSWREAGSIFRSRVTQEAWVEAAKTVRSPLGPLNTRSLLNVKVSQSLPGLPDGDYAIVQFRSA